MTHNDIYTKFMIEYDKANVTSSYPALTKYEVATLLDRAYLTLIARKLTGNNTRKVPFEYDTKAIEDLRPLVVTAKFSPSVSLTTASNEYVFTLPSNLLYYLEGIAEFGTEREVVQPINHQLARKFKATNSNIPWINSPVSYIEDTSIHIFIDPFEHKLGPLFDGTYIKKPISFVSSLTQTEDPTGGEDPNPGTGSNGGGNDTTETIPAPVIRGEDNFTDSTSITIDIPTGTNVYYTINDGDPTSSSTEYLAPFTISNTSIIKAIAIKGDNKSSIATKTFTKQEAPSTLYSITASITNVTDEGVFITYTATVPSNTNFKVYSGESYDKIEWDYSGAQVLVNEPSRTLAYRKDIKPYYVLFVLKDHTGTTALAYSNIITVPIKLTEDANTIILTLKYKDEEERLTVTSSAGGSGSDLYFYFCKEGQELSNSWLRYRGPLLMKHTTYSIIITKSSAKGKSFKAMLVKHGLTVIPENIIATSNIETIHSSSGGGTSSGGNDNPIDIDPNASPEFNQDFESENTNTGGSTSGIVEMVLPFIDFSSYDYRMQSPFRDEGYNEKGLRYGIMLYSYLESNLQTPISERILDESEYSKYLGNGYNISTSVSIKYRTKDFRNELFNEPLHISLWPSGSTDFEHDANLKHDNYEMDGVPTVWDVLVNMSGINNSGVKPYAYGYRDLIEDNVVFNWSNTFYNTAIKMWGPDDDPIVEYTGTITAKTGSNKQLTPATEVINVPVNPGRDLSLDHLFVIIPYKYKDKNGNECTWETFKDDPDHWVNVIKENDKHTTIVKAKEDYISDFKEVVKNTIVRNATDRFGITFNSTSLTNINNYLNDWLKLCERRGIDMRDRVEDMVVGWFKTYDPKDVGGQYGIELNPGIIYSDFDGVWNGERYTASAGYNYTSTKNIITIPRFDKIYCLDNAVENGSGIVITKGPIQDMNNCPRFENNISSIDTAIDGSWDANPGDIVVELNANPPENKNAIEYYVMYDLGGTKRTELLFPLLMFDISGSIAYLTSANLLAGGKSDRFYNTHNHDYCEKNNVVVSLPYEEVLEISTGNILNESITSLEEGKYARYGGLYTIFAFKVNKPFCIKDTKWGFGEYIELGE